MKRMKKSCLVVILMLILNNIAYSALRVSSSKITVETMTTTVGENRIQYFDGTGSVRVERDWSESAYLGLRLLENVGRRATEVILEGKNEYVLKIQNDETMEVTVSISNITASVGTVSRSGENPTPTLMVLRFGDTSVKSSVLTYNYSIKIISKSGVTNKARVALAVDSGKNFNSNEVVAAEFFEINLQDNGSLMGVNLGVMDFGGNVKFGQNEALAPLKLELRNSEKIPLNTFVELDSQIMLHHTSLSGTPIPMAVSLAGNVEKESEGRYRLRDLNNGVSVANLNVKGITDLKVGQESGTYKGNINIRITYTK